MVKNEDKFFQYLNDHIHLKRETWMKPYNDTTKYPTDGDRIAARVWININETIRKKGNIYKIKFKFLPTGVSKHLHLNRKPSGTGWELAEMRSYLNSNMKYSYMFNFFKNDEIVLTTHELGEKSDKHFELNHVGTNEHGTIKCGNDEEFTITEYNEGKKNSNWKIVIDTSNKIYNARTKNQIGCLKF